MKRPPKKRDQWYFTHAGLTCGPVTTTELDTLIAAGRLDPQDCLWPAGVDVQITLPTYQAMLRSGSLPDWLEDIRGAEPQAAEQRSRQAGAGIERGRASWLMDVEQAERGRAAKPPARPSPPAIKPPQPPPLPPKQPQPAQPLDWLQDIRQVEGRRSPPAPAARPPSGGRPTTPMPAAAPLTQPTPAPTKPPAAPLPPPASIPMDWLEDIRQIEESLRPRPAPPSKPPPLSAPSAPAVRPTAPPQQPPPTAAVRPVATPQSPLPAAAVRPAAPQSLPPAATVRSAAPSAAPLAPADKPPAPPAPAVAAPVPREQPAPQPPPAAPEPATPEEMGFNPETGQILDPAKHARWQQLQQKKRQEELQAQPGVTVYEAFLSARKALQDRIDSDQVKPLIVSGNVTAVQKDTQVQTIVLSYHGYGPVMQEKLMKHLCFLVENRQKFYAAFS